MAEFAQYGALRCVDLSPQVQICHALWVMRNVMEFLIYRVERSFYFAFCNKTRFRPSRKLLFLGNLYSVKKTRFAIINLKFFLYFLAMGWRRAAQPTRTASRLAPTSRIFHWSIDQLLLTGYIWPLIDTLIDISMRFVPFKKHLYFLLPPPPIRPT
jgi:hypothetical protein